MTVRKQLGRLAVLGALALPLVANSAAAQDPELGDTGTGTGGQWQGGQQQQGGQWGQQQGQTPPQGGQWGQQGGQQQPPAGGQWGQTGGQQPAGGQWGAGGDTEHPTTPATPTAAGATDHSMMVGHLAVGFFGVQGVTVGIGGGGPVSASIDVSAPTIGIRYWLAERIGLDVALGIGFQTGSAKVDTPGGVTSVDIEQAFALALHGGLPIALYSGQHYNFMIIPELNLGFGSGTLFGATPNDDQNLNGFFFNIGARAGGEVHFGFIGVPELSLEGSVGIDLGFNSGSVENDLGNPAGSTITTVTALQIATTVQNNPWNIFIANISAKYYFP